MNNAAVGYAQKMQQRAKIDKAEKTTRRQVMVTVVTTVDDVLPKLYGKVPKGVEFFLNDDTYLFPTLQLAVTRWVETGTDGTLFAKVHVLYLGNYVSEWRGRRNGWSPWKEE